MLRYIIISVLSLVIGWLLCRSCHAPCEKQGAGTTVITKPPADTTTKPAEKISKDTVVITKPAEIVYIPYPQQPQGAIDTTAIDSCQTTANRLAAALYATKFYRDTFKVGDISIFIADSISRNSKIFQSVSIKDLTQRTEIHTTTIEKKGGLWIGPGISYSEKFGVGGQVTYLNKKGKGLSYTGDLVNEWHMVSTQFPIFRR